LSSVQGARETRHSLLCVPLQVNNPPTFERDTPLRLLIGINQKTVAFPLKSEALFLSVNNWNFSGPFDLPPLPPPALSTIRKSARKDELASLILRYIQINPFPPYLLLFLFVVASGIRGTSGF